MGISASIPVAQMESANAALEAKGHGPNNFSVPLRTGTGDATHAGLHCWDDPDFIADLKALPFDVEWTEGSNDKPNFDQHVAAKAFDPKAATEWYQDPIMKGDQRTDGGKLWESLIDYNVWGPPIGWREIVAEGFPAWVQPVGAVDAYPLGAKVTFGGQNWENTGSPANVWRPGVFGWIVI